MNTSTLTFDHRMSASEYASYEAAVVRFTSDWNIIGRGSPTGETDEFSKRPCDCCRRHLAGSRETYQFVTSLNPLQAEICTDCVYYLTYGQLDDLTMLEMGGAQ